MKRVRTQIERDLQEKLVEDIKRACIHFADMCSRADIPSSSQAADIILLLARLMIELTQHSFHVPKEVFISMISKMWDRYKEST